MTTYIEKIIALKYKELPSKGFNTEDEMFVGLDESTNNLPIRVTASKAKDFKTIKKANSYKAIFPIFEIVELTITSTTVSLEDKQL